MLPTYHGKVKCIYIDPPYNTGNEARAYQSKPEILAKRRERYAREKAFATPSGLSRESGEPGDG